MCAEIPIQLSLNNHRMDSLTSLPLLPQKTLWTSDEVSSFLARLHMPVFECTAKIKEKLHLGIPHCKHIVSTEAASHLRAACGKSISSSESHTQTSSLLRTTTAFPPMKDDDHQILDITYANYHYKTAEGHDIPL